MATHLGAENTHSLTIREMRVLADTLRGAPYPPTSNAQAAYHRRTQSVIKNLPCSLRHSSPTSRSNALCSTHRQLNDILIGELWSWIRYEFEAGARKFAYRIAASGKLTNEQFVRVMQCKSVSQMWHIDDALQGRSSSEPHKAYDVAVLGPHRWIYQFNQCPACMLARIGSDEAVLCALLAGMVGRLEDPSEKKGLIQTGSAQKTVWSARIQWVVQWIYACDRGEEMAGAAYELGLELATIRWGRRNAHKNSLATQSTQDHNTLRRSADMARESCEELHAVKALSSKKSMTILAKEALHTASPHVVSYPDTRVLRCGPPPLPLALRPLLPFKPPTTPPVFPAAPPQPNPYHTAIYPQPLDPRQSLPNKPLITSRWSDTTIQTTAPSAPHPLSTIAFENPRLAPHPPFSLFKRSHSVSTQSKHVSMDDHSVGTGNRRPRIRRALSLLILRGKRLGPWVKVPEVEVT